MKIQFFCLSGHLIKEKISESMVALDIKDRDVAGITCDKCGAKVDIQNITFEI